MTLGGAALLASEARRSAELARRWQRMSADALGVYANSAAEAHEDPQKWEARAYLADLEKRTGIRAWLFDARGAEVSGYARREREARPNLQKSLSDIMARARTSNQTEFEPLGDITLAARASSPLDGRVYVLGAQMPTARFAPWDANAALQGARLAGVLLAASVVAWSLVRHLTSPILALRRATQRLASGDLAARAEPDAEKRRDEMGDLARDFNAMAARLEVLVHEHERLVESQKRLLGDVAHELRSPLARINVALELARDEVSEATLTAASTAASTSEPSEIEDAHNRIEREVGRLGDLISRLLTLSRLESGVQKRGEVLVELAALIESVAADANFEVRPSKNVAFEARCESCALRGTPELLRSAIENIVRNAVRHAPASTCVQISLARENTEDGARWHQGGRCFVSAAPDEEASAYAVISVRDSGPGVPEEELSQVFRPFYRAGSGRATREGGAGLGLAIALRAVEVHGGQMRACNAEGGGLLVEARLPLDTSDNEIGA
jgi:two-component system sensor histidine kinase CpxA